MTEHDRTPSPPSIAETARGVLEKGPPKTDVGALQKSLFGLSGKKRLDIILSCPDVLRVVQRLPVQDLFSTVKEVGIEDSLELIELLRPRQIQGFLDLDAWRKDRLDPVALGDWLEAIYAASPAKAVRQILGLDIELLALLFKMHAQVFDLTLEEEPEGEPRFHSITPDHRYLLVYDPENEKLALAMKNTVERLFGVDPGFVLRLVESVRWEMPSALEEECYRWRNGRLADLGFVPLEEAGEIFAYRDPDKAAAEFDVPLKPVDPILDHEEGPQDLSSTLWLPDALLGDGGDVLRDALELVDETHVRRVRHELVLVANRLHMALGGDAGDPDALKATAQQAANTIGIGLSYLAKGDAAGLKQPLEQVPGLRLFQIGHSVTLRLGRQLRAQTKNPASGLYGQGILRLDHPLREVVAGCLRPHPLFYIGLSEEKRSDFIPFRSLADVAETARAIAEAAFRASLVGGKALDANDARLEGLGIRDARTGPSHGVLLATWLSHQMLTQKGEFRALSNDDLLHLRSQCGTGGWQNAADARALAALEEVARAAAPLPGAAEPERAGERARAYGNQVLTGLCAELQGLPAGSAVDGRFIHGVFTEAVRNEFQSPVETVSMGDIGGEST